MKKSKAKVLDPVWEKIIKREIWIPYFEYETNAGKIIDKLNHKSPLFIPLISKNKKKKQAPLISSISFVNLTYEEKEFLKERFSRLIEHYISQTLRLPSERVEKSIKSETVRLFNRKIAAKRQVKLLVDEHLINLLTEIKTIKYDELKETILRPDSANNERYASLVSSGIVLESERMLFRKMKLKDYSQLRSMLSDPDVMYAWERTFNTKSEIYEWIKLQMTRYKKDKLGYFLAIDKADQTIIGQIGLMWNSIQGKRCLEVGYILCKNCWHKGYATEGAKAFIEFGFSLFNIEKIYAKMRPENTASIAVAERLGMKCDGEYIKSYQGKKMKHFIYSCSKTNLVQSCDLP